MQATDTVTVVNRTDNGFVLTVVSGVYWYRAKSIAVQGNGVANSAEPSCIFPYDALENYTEDSSEVQNGRFTLKRKDYLILGEVSGITSVKDVNQYDDVITIKSIDRHLKGSPRIQHITIS